MKMKTDWDNVAEWYDNYLDKDDTYQSVVIAPNLIRMLDIKKGMKVLDVACGQGYFSKLVAKTNSVIGIDQSKALIEIAKSSAGKNEDYLVGNAEKLGESKLGKFDRIFTVLAFENIKNIGAVLSGMEKSLEKGGKIVLVLLHPAFRIPQHSDWGYDIKRNFQFRKVEKYLSEVTIPIKLTPFKGDKSVVTNTFHRSLQWYMKAFKSSGFAISAIEEWISHKKSSTGPRQSAEDTARKEFPMFLALELKKVL